MRSTFDIPEILPNKIVQVSALLDSDHFLFVRVQCGQYCRISATFSGSPWCLMALRKKRNAAFGGQQETNQSVQYFTAEFAMIGFTK